jgi:hypothetical protein
MSAARTLWNQWWGANWVVEWQECGRKNYRLILGHVLEFKWKNFGKLRNFSFTTVCHITKILAQRLRSTRSARTKECISTCRPLKNARNRKNQRRESQTIYGMAVEEINPLEIAAHSGKESKFASDVSWSLSPSPNDNLFHSDESFESDRKSMVLWNDQLKGNVWFHCNGAALHKILCTFCQQLRKSVATRIHPFGFAKSCSKVHSHSVPWLGKSTSDQALKVSESLHRLNYMNSN